MKNTRSSITHVIDEVWSITAAYGPFGATGNSIESLVAHDVDATIEFDYMPGRPGRTYGPPEDCYPDEPAELSIHAIKANGSFEFFGEDMRLTVADGYDLMKFLSGREVEELEEMILALAEDN